MKGKPSSFKLQVYTEMRLTELERYERGNTSTLKTEVFREKSLTDLEFLNVRPA